MPNRVKEELRFFFAIYLSSGLSADRAGKLPARQCHTFAWVTRVLLSQREGQKRDSSRNYCNVDRTVTVDPDWSLP